jgi:hypothetical protein
MLLFGAYAGAMIAYNKPSHLRPRPFFAYQRAVDKKHHAE